MLKILPGKLPSKKGSKFEGCNFQLLTTLSFFKFFTKKFSFLVSFSFNFFAPPYVRMARSCAYAIAARHSQLQQRYIYSRCGGAFDCAFGHQNLVCQCVVRSSFGSSAHFSLPSDFGAYLFWIN